MKRFLACLLCICMTISLCAVGASAVVAAATITVDGTSTEITGYGAAANDTYTGTLIAALRNSDLSGKNVVINIPSGVTLYAGVMQDQAAAPNCCVGIPAGLGSLTFTGSGTLMINGAAQPYLFCNGVPTVIDGITLRGANNGDYASVFAGTSHTTLTSGAQNTYSAGDLTSTNLTLKSGTVGSLFGGSMNTNVGTANVTVTGGSIAGAIVGGSVGTGTCANFADTKGGQIGTVNVTVSQVAFLTGNSNGYIYGGGNAETLTAAANIKMSGGTCMYLCGTNGSNVTTTTIELSGTGCVTSNIFGGGLNGGSVVNSNVTINGGTARGVYGGGFNGTSTVDDVTVTNAKVTVTGGSVTSGVFGGGYAGGSKKATVDAAVVTLQGGTIASVWAGGSRADNATGACLTKQSAVNISGSDTKITDLQVTTASKRGAAVGQTPTCAITGGKFASDPSEYLSGSVFAITNTGADAANYPYAVSTTAAASIGTTMYGSLEKAISAAKSDETVKLLTDATLSKTVTLDKSISLDMNGFDITAVSCRAFLVTAGTLNLTGAGTVSSVHVDGDSLLLSSSVIRVSGDAGNAGLTVGKDVTVSSPWCFGVSIFGTNSNSSSNTKSLVVNGTISVTGNNAGAIAGNGTSGRGNTSITVNSGAVVYSKDAVAIYHPQVGTLTINGGTISGKQSSIAIKSGTLIMSGGTVQCFGPDSTPTQGYSNGVYASGAAIQIEANDGYVGNIKIEITGGNITSDNGCSIYEYIGVDADHNNQLLATDTKVTQISVTGGNFNGKIMSSSQFAAKAYAGFVSGGYFTADPTAYLADGKAAVASDKTGYTFMIGEKGSTPAIPVVTAPVVQSSISSSSQTVKDAVKVITDNTDNIQQTGLEGPAASLANDSTVTATQAERALAAAGITPASDDLTPVVYEQAYLDIAITDAVVENGAVTAITVSITPMSQTVASYETDPTKVDTGSNAAAIGEPKELDITSKTPVTITFPIPASMVPAEAAGGSRLLTVKHEKETGAVYYYDAAVSQTEGVWYASFTVTHGFSDFTIMARDTRTTQILFNKDSSADVGPVTYTATNVSDAFPEDSKSGYTFNGWTFSGITGAYKTLTDELLTKLSAAQTDPPLNAAPSFTLIETKPVSYTLSFETNGGTAIAAVSKTKDTKIALSAYAPTRDGCTFAGWYADAALTTAITSVTLTKDTTVYAKWTQNSISYSMLKGEKQTVVLSEKVTATFQSEADFSKFVKVQVDGKDVAAKNYTTASSKTTVTLNSAYLNTLSIGKHTISIVSTDGKAETTFTITKSASAPKTGDNANLMLLLALCLVSLGAAATVVQKRRRKAKQ